MTSFGIGLKDAQRSEVNVSYRIRATENGSMFEAVVRMELYVQHLEVCVLQDQTRQPRHD